MNVTRTSRVYAVLRRRKRLVLVTALIVAIALLPLAPYSPRCSDKGEPASVGSILLAKKFKRALGESLDYWGVPHLAISRIILLPFWTWLDDPDDLVLKASGESVLHFVDASYGARLEAVPPRVMRMIEEARNSNGFIELECPLVRAVAIDGW